MFSGFPFNADTKNLEYIIGKGVKIDFLLNIFQDHT